MEEERLTNEWIVVNEVVEFPGPKGKAAHDLAGLDLLLRVGDGSALDKGQNAVGKHL